MSDDIAARTTCTGGPGLKYTEEDMCIALLNNHGLVVHAAQELGCSRWTVHQYIKRFPAVAQARNEGRQIIVDEAERSLLDAVRDREPWAVTLVLKTLGKRLGYTERSEIGGMDGGPIKVTLNLGEREPLTDESEHDETVEYEVKPKQFKAVGMPLVEPGEPGQLLLDETTLDRHNRTTVRRVRD